MLGKYSMQSVAAVIVTFNPDLAFLEKNIRAIRPQVTKIILVDNGSKNISNIQLLISELEDISCLSLRENTGIAAAQNKGFAELYKQGFSWAVLLD
ncbi:glycosyltransferase [Weissella cibaria]